MQREKESAQREKDEALAREAFERQEKEAALAELAALRQTSGVQSEVKGLPAPAEPKLGGGSNRFFQGSPTDTEYDQGNDLALAKQHDAGR